MTDPPPPQPAGLSIFVRALTVAAEIGMHAHERGRRQPLVIDVELELAPASVIGIRDTVNYEMIAARARAVAASGHVDLVETFAERLARSCLGDARVRRVRVRVEKPEAIRGAAAAGVEIVIEAAC